jgi:hypothetical protein
MKRGSQTMLNASLSAMSGKPQYTVNAEAPALPGMESLATPGILNWKGAVESRAQKINKLHDGIIDALRKSVDKAIEIGELLTEQKAALAHGEWLPWLKANIKFAERTAQDYMRFYEHRKMLKSANVADLREARRLLPKKPKPEPEPVAKPEAELVRVELEPIVVQIERAEPEPEDEESRANRLLETMERIWKDCDFFGRLKRELSPNDWAFATVALIAAGRFNPWFDKTHDLKADKLNVTFGNN